MGIPAAMIAIGLARVSESEEIARLSRDLIESGLAWTWTPARVAASIRSKDANVAVARTDDRIVGFGIMRYGDDEAHLDLFAVRPGQRLLGIGRRLIEWLEAPARVAGMTAVMLEVRAANHAAHAFYERLGYRKVARLARYYQGREAALRMVHDLGMHAQRVEPRNDD